MHFEYPVGPIQICLNTQQQCETGRVKNHTQKLNAWRGVVIHYWRLSAHQEIPWTIMVSQKVERANELENEQTTFSADYIAVIKRAPVRGWNQSLRLAIMGKRNIRFLTKCLSSVIIRSDRTNTLELLIERKRKPNPWNNSRITLGKRGYSQNNDFRIHELLVASRISSPGNPYLGLSPG
jgi:hypothetical protein